MNGMSWHNIPFVHLLWVVIELIEFYFEGTLLSHIYARYIAFECSQVRFLKGMPFFLYLPNEDNITEKKLFVDKQYLSNNYVKINEQYPLEKTKIMMNKTYLYN